MSPIFYLLCFEYIKDLTKWGTILTEGSLVFPLNRVWWSISVLSIQWQLKTLYWHFHDKFMNESKTNWIGPQVRREVAVLRAEVRQPSWQLHPSHRPLQEHGRQLWRHRRDEGPIRFGTTRLSGRSGQVHRVQRHLLQQAEDVRTPGGNFPDHFYQPLDHKARLFCTILFCDLENCLAFLYVC